MFIVAVVAPFLAGLVLAFLVQFIPPARQGLAERLIVFVFLAAAVALDLRTEGPEHGVLGFLLLTLPGILSFVTARFVLSRRTRSAVRTK